MQILYFADTRFPLERANGIQTFRTCHALACRGHAVRLIVRPDTAATRRDPFAFYDEPPTSALQIEPLTVGGGLMARRASWLARALARAVHERRADIVLTRDLGFAGLLVRLPRALRARVVYESHGFAPAVGASLDQMLTNGRAASGSKQARLERREGLVWERADGYVTITRALADELESRFGARQNVVVVADGVRLPCVAPPTPARQDPPVVGYAGHLYPWKGVDVLLDAVARLHDVRALIVGGLEAEPDLERTRARARALGIEDRVRFTGAIPPSQVPARLAEMDILVLPNTATHISSRYTSPLKLFEYMAAGRPIIASDLPALREVLRNGDNALLVEAGDGERLAAAIMRLLDDRRMAARLAAIAWNDVQAYSWDERAARLEALFERIRPAEAIEKRGATV